MKKYLLALLCCVFFILGFVPAADASAATELYKMRVDNWAFPKSGQPVSTSCTITIDGQSASIGYVPANNCYCAYILYTCPEKPAEYSITVLNGTANKANATAGTQIFIVANEDTSARKFSNWVVVSVGSDVFTKINAKAVIKVPSKKVTSYKKLFKKAGLTGSSQTVKSK